MSRGLHTVERQRQQQGGVWFRGQWGPHGCQVHHPCAIDVQLMLTKTNAGRVRADGVPPLSRCRRRC